MKTVSQLIYAISIALYCAPLYLRSHVFEAVVAGATLSFIAFFLLYADLWGVENYYKRQRITTVSFVTFVILFVGGFFAYPTVMLGTWMQFAGMIIGLQGAILGEGDIPESEAR